MVEAKSVTIYVVYDSKKCNNICGLFKQKVQQYIACHRQKYNNVLTPHCQEKTPLDEAIRILQKSERGRQGRQRAMFMTEISKQVKLLKQKV